MNGWSPVSEDNSRFPKSTTNSDASADKSHKLCFFCAPLWPTSVRIRRMEIVFPVSMLAVGLLVGTVSLWFITRTQLKYEFDRGRADGETARATLTERLARKEDQLRELRDALDREIDQ